MSKTYQIPESNLGQLKEKIEKLGRKAARLGLPEIGLNVLGHEDIGFVRSPTGGNYKALPNQVPDFFRRYYSVEIRGSTPRLNGWEFVAVLQHLVADGETINLLRISPGFEGQIPEQYRTAEYTNCDHCCKVIKTRKETFVVRHEDGSWKQIGRNCLADFIGGTDPHDLAKGLEYLLAAAEAAESESGYGDTSGRNDRVPLTTFLDLAAACVRVDGWVSRGASRASDGRIGATADAVTYLMNPPKPHTEAYADWKKFSAEHQITDQDKDVAAKALEFVLETCDGPDLSDYEFNLSVVARQEAIDFKMYGIAASIIPFWTKEQSRRAERANLKNSKHFGEVGKRQDWYVTVLKEITTEGQFGTTYIYKMLTRDGNLATWFASGKQDLVVGKEYRLAATVKAHREYQGVLETQLTRGSVYTEEGRKLAEEKETRKTARLAKKAAKEGVAQ